MTDTVIRKEQDGFVIVSNKILNDPEISMSAKGMYAYMKSKPDNWNFTIRSMASQLKEGQTAISSAVRELRDCGLVTYIKQSNGTGVYFVHSTLRGPEPKPENPDQDFPKMGKPKRISNTDLSSKKDSNSVAHEILDYLNRVSGKKFRPVPASTNLIMARIKEGATVDEIKAVIDCKAAEWNGTKYSMYLRPSTLFNASKFGDYLGAIGDGGPSSDSPFRGNVI